MKKQGEMVMSKRRLVPLAGLVLALAALTPASALAKPGIGPAVAVSGPAKASKAGGSDRPFMGVSSGFSTFCPTTGLGSGDSSGVATLVGKFTIHADTHVTGIIPLPFTIISEGDFTLVSANGDQVTGTITDTAIVKVNEAGESIGHEATLVLNVLGGTGRFADASGTATAVQDGTVQYRDENYCAHDFNQETITGHVSY
jgi:hypothetical protein